MGPGKFYGSSLPRPRFYTDIKHGSDRVDPPASVMDPFLSWAQEAHWSMGGLSLKRPRLMGRIEGSVKKLRAQQTRSDKEKKNMSKIRPEEGAKIRKLIDNEAEWPDSDSDSEPEPEPEVEVKPEPERGVEVVRKRGRKLVEEFERVADADRVASRTRSRKPGSDKSVVVNGAKGRRTSPRKSAV